MNKKLLVTVLIIIGVFIVGCANQSTNQNTKQQPIQSASTVETKTDNSKVKDDITSPTPKSSAATNSTQEVSYKQYINDRYGKG